MCCNHSLACNVGHEELKAAFSIKKMRLAHHLTRLHLRSCGAQLPAATVESIYGALSEERIRNKWCKGLLDLGIICVDSAAASSAAATSGVTLGKRCNMSGRLWRAWKDSKMQPNCAWKWQKMRSLLSAGKKGQCALRLCRPCLQARKQKAAPAQSMLA